MNLMEVLQRRCREHPDKILWEDERFGALTFRDVDVYSARVYNYLSEVGIGKEDVVTIRMARSVRVLIVMLGIWKAGAAFAVIGEHSPQQMVDFVIEDTSPKLLFDENCFERAMTCSAKMGFESSDPHDLACIVYSTGSSGRFKGSMHEYGAIQKVLAAADFWDSDDRVYSETRTAFSAGMYSMPAVMLLIDSIVFSYGAYIVPHRMICDEVALGELILRQKINSITIAPQQFEYFRALKSPDLTDVYLAYDLGGFAPMPGLNVWNSYGLTESMRILTCFRIDKSYDVIPIGQPNPTVQMMLADRQGRQLSSGEIGEICFVSEYFRGYRNRPEVTAAALYDGWFHTGDIGTLDARGNYIVLGRRIDIYEDERGFIIPCQISAQVRRKFPDLARNYVRVFESEIGPKVCLYYCSEREHGLKEFREALCDALPERMLPTHCRRLEKFSYFPSGKIERLAFPELS